MGAVYRRARSGSVRPAPPALIPGRPGVRVRPRITLSPSRSSPSGGCSIVDRAARTGRAGVPERVAIT